MKIIIHSCGKRMKFEEMERPSKGIILFVLETTGVLSRKWILGTGDFPIQE